MTIEKVEKANELLREIEALQTHLKSVTVRKYENSQYSPYESPFNTERPNFLFSPYFYKNDVGIELRDYFLPFPIDKFMQMYMANIKEGIKRREKEFDNL